MKNKQVKQAIASVTGGRWLTSKDCYIFKNYPPIIVFKKDTDEDRFCRVISIKAIEVK